ncbi:hypothetical protein [Solitalea lacus]|uniref:hypothetical protein n=1 Tax=Solitalea lacus TaxID=2911172 RepID=UPI001EDBD465|nr:hypothetical protein [Solitalea lacus]UKJ09063.1 hypothetical protein L2B55_07825 [Solitalea lacus]
MDGLPNDSLRREAINKKYPVRKNNFIKNVESTEDPTAEELASCGEGYEFQTEREYYSGQVGGFQIDAEDPNGQTYRARWGVWTQSQCLWYIDSYERFVLYTQYGNERIQDSEHLYSVLLGFNNYVNWTELEHFHQRGSYSAVVYLRGVLTVNKDGALQYSSIKERSTACTIEDIKRGFRY